MLSYITCADKLITTWALSVYTSDVIHNLWFLISFQEQLSHLSSLYLHISSP